MGKIRVLRGQTNAVQYGGIVQLIQNDQRFTHGYRIRKFVIAYRHPYDPGSGSRDCYGVLATHKEAILEPFTGNYVEWDWSDRAQVAWTSTNHVGDSLVEFNRDLVDPTHIVVRDLYVGITGTTVTDGIIFNYYVELEEVELSENQAVLAIVQEESQGV